MIKILSEFDTEGTLNKITSLNQKLKQLFNSNFKAVTLIGQFS